jgi:hypothetical protein
MVPAKNHWVNVMFVLSVTLAVNVIGHAVHIAMYITDVTLTPGRVSVV